jgi:hypothetical protein
MAMEAFEGMAPAPRPLHTANTLGSQWPWLQRSVGKRYVEARNLTVIVGDMDRLNPRVLSLHPKLGGVLDIASRDDQIELVAASGLVAALDAETLDTRRCVQLDTPPILAKLLTGSVIAITGSEHDLMEYDSATGKMKRKISVDGAYPVSLSSSPDGGFGLVTARGGRMFRIEPEEAAVELPSLGAFSASAVIDRTGSQAAVGLYGGRMAILKPASHGASWKPNILALSRGKSFHHISWSPNGRALLCAYRDGDAVLIRRSKRGWVTIELDLAGEHFRFVDWSDDDSELRLMSNRALRTYAMTDGRMMSIHPTPFDCIGAVFPQPSALAFWLTNARLLDASTRLGVPGWSVRATATLGNSSESAEIAVAVKSPPKIKYNETDNRIIAKPAGLPEIEIYRGDYDTFESSQSGQMFWISLPGGTIVLGRIEGDQAFKTVERSRNRVVAHEYASDELHLLLRYDDGSIELIDLQSQTPLAIIPTFVSERDKVGFAKDARAILFAADDGRIGRFDFHQLCLRADDLARAMTDVLVTMPTNEAKTSVDLGMRSDLEPPQ